jgi:phage tail protein X
MSTDSDVRIAFVWRYAASTLSIIARTASANSGVSC